jgi:hypothetical protein
MNKTLFYVLGGLAVAGLGYLIYRVTTIDNTSNYEFVQKKGATPFKTESGQEGVISGRYQFYPNNRVMNNVEKKMGTFDKKSILWDDGSATEMKEVFPK